MKPKIICLVLIYLLSVRCDDKQEVDNHYGSYINIDFNNLNNEDLQLFIEAAKRFSEYVYLDENNVYKISINKGADIGIGENIFSVLAQSLKYREQLKLFENKVINMEINSGDEKLPLTRTFPSGNYDQWVYGQLNYLWNEIIGTWQSVNEAMVNFFCVVIGASVLTVIDYVCMPFFGPGIIISPEDDPYCNVPPLAVGMEFRTNLPNGLYPSPGNREQYVAVRNGIATVKFCESARFSWYRKDSRYYSREDEDLIEM
ncbi:MULTISPECIES: hypothetical protein [Butyricimonas]|uniref:hypothetical protein n=1 Tax=Butyricimonas TaxID=574697 RepID=UPI001D05CBAD|nr:MULTISPECIES: hypothetical protein [Butyricimonas]MCB6974685.1 hypothetical protein [Butyricimonas synergistica]MCG4521461.1 hypothetical protein [Butyricimonas sp. DFI.6.44]